MELGDRVIYRGRPFVVRGFDPMSVAHTRVQLEDERTGEVVVVPLAELEPPAVSGEEP